MQSLRDVEELLVSEFTGKSSTKDLDERVGVYKKLLRRGKLELMNSIYPYSAELLNKNWDAIVLDYFEKCPPTHFNLNQAAAGFSAYLREHQEKHLKKYPFLPELADYEWIELELMETEKNCEVSDFQTLNEPEKFSTYGPVVNQVLATRTYEYPITMLITMMDAKKRLPKVTKRETIHIAAFRDPVTHKTKFLELNEMARALIDLAKENPVSYADLITTAVQLKPENDPQATIVELLDLIDILKELSLFVGDKAL